MSKSGPDSASESASKTTSDTDSDTPSIANNYTPRPMNWSSIVKDGNVVDVDDVDGSWLSVGKRGPVSNHGGKILPKYRKKTLASDAQKTEDHNDKDDKNNKNDKDAQSNTEDPTSPVFIIFSQWTIPEIEDYLYSVADNEDQIGTVRIDYFKGEQTDRTIVVMDPSLYHKFRDNFASGFSMTPYDIRHHWYPQEKIGETFNFFIPLPSTLSTAACREGLRIKMKELVNFGMFKSESDYGIFIPVADREGTEHTNRAYVEFDQDVDCDAVVMARCVLSYSKWSYKNSHIVGSNDALVKCYYKKDNRTDRNEGGRFKGPKGKSPNDRSSKDKSPPKTPARPRVALKIPTIPVEGSSTNPFEILSKADDSE